MSPWGTGVPLNATLESYVPVYRQFDRSFATQPQGYLVTRSKTNPVGQAPTAAAILDWMAPSVSCPKVTRVHFTH